MALSPYQTMKVIICLLLLINLTSVADATTITKLIQFLANIVNDEQKIQHFIRERLSQSIGFGVPIFIKSAVNDIDGRSDNNSSTRKLTAEYKFTPCPNERPCNKIIATYTKTQVKDIIDTILSTLINVEGCLDEYSEYYGQCRVDDDCICPTFVSSLVCPFGLFCATPICQEDCYRNSLEST